MATVTYHAARLEFRRREIEPLALDDKIRIVAKPGTFEMTKRQFLSTFDNVVRSRSYQAGSYNYKTVPGKAEQYRVG